MPALKVEVEFPKNVAIPEEKTFPAIEKVSDGDVVEIPTRLCNVSKLNNGMAVEEVANEKAFTEEVAIVEVAEFTKDTDPELIIN